MIPFIRSHSELMAITESRNIQNDLSKNHENDSSVYDSGQRKRYIRSLNEKEIDLPKLPKNIRNTWTKTKDFESSFINDIDLNNQRQSLFNCN